MIPTLGDWFVFWAEAYQGDLLAQLTEETASGHWRIRYYSPWGFVEHAAIPKRTRCRRARPADHLAARLGAPVLTGGTGKDRFPAP